MYLTITRYYPNNETFPGFFPSRGFEVSPLTGKIVAPYAESRGRKIKSREIQGGGKSDFTGGCWGAIT